MMENAAVHTDRSDAELAALLREGDERAFIALYKKYSSKLYVNTLKLVKDEQIAEELVQELFAKIWHKRAELQIESSIAAYLYRTAQNLVHDFFRKLQRDRKLHDHFLTLATEHYEHIEEQLHYKESKSLLDQALARLSPQQRNVYQLCKIEGLSYKEAAADLGISVNTIKEYLIKANKEVKAYLLSNLDASFGLLVYLLFKDRLR